jgi:tRNA threonylcarbamoyladenosine biosynthesis protein TsaE
MQINIKHLKELEKAAKQILEIAKEERIFLFFGEMGAGKTTLVNEIAKHLGTLDHTSSPTFSIVNEYKTALGPIFHFDFYRLKNQTEALDMGYEDYFYSGNYCLVEWPEKISDLWPSHYVSVTIETVNENERILKVVLI